MRLYLCDYGVYMAHKTKVEQREKEKNLTQKTVFCLNSLMLHKTSAFDEKSIFGWKRGENFFSFCCCL